MYEILFHFPLNQTVVGGVQDCNDFGINLNSGTFRAFVKLSKECPRDMDAKKPLVSIGQWYMIAVTNNATHMLIYQNGEYREDSTVCTGTYRNVQKCVLVQSYTFRKNVINRRIRQLRSTAVVIT